jgi:hypothetical protein
MPTANSFEVIITDTKKQGKYVAKFFYQEAEIYSGLLDTDLTDSQQRYAKKAYLALKQIHPDLDVSQNDIFQVVRQAIDRFTREEVLPEQEELSEQEQAIIQQADLDAEEMANSPDLLKQIAEDLKMIGITKQTEIALAAYLTGTSRLLDEPLHMMIQGTPSSGKSFIVTTVSSLFPDKEKLPFGRMSPASLYHSCDSIKHKFLILNERPRQHDAKDVDRMAAYRELISEKRTCQYTTETTPDGKFVSRYKSAEGPVSSIGTLTHDDISTEDRTRFIIMSIRTPKKLTRFILARKRVRKLDQHDDIKALRERIRYKHIAFQSKLQQHTVHVSPIIEELIRLSLERVGLHEEVLRYFERCRSLVATITLLYQRQRRKSKNNDAIRATLKDYEMARPVIDAWLGGVLLEGGGQISKQAMVLFEKLQAHKDINKGLTARMITKDCGGGYSERSIYDFLDELVKAGLLSKKRFRPNGPYIYRLETPVDAKEEQTITIPATLENVWLAMRNVQKDDKEVKEYETTPSYIPPYEKYPHLYQRKAASSDDNEKLTVQEVQKKITHLRLAIKTRGENGKSQSIPTAKEWDRAGRTPPKE